MVDVGLRCAAIWSFLQKGVNGVVQAYVVIVSRVLLPDVQFQNFILAYSVALSSALLLKFGIGDFAIRVARKASFSVRASVILTGIRINAVAFATILAINFAWFFYFGVVFYGLVGVLLGTLAAIELLLADFMRSSDKIYLGLLYQNFLRNVLILGLVSIVAYFGSSALTSLLFFGAVCCAYIGSVCISLYSSGIMKYTGVSSNIWDAFRLLRKAFRFLRANGVTFVFPYLDVWTAMAVLPVNESAAYAFASRVVAVFSLPGHSINWVISKDIVSRLKLRKSTNGSPYRYLVLGATIITLTGGFAWVGVGPHIIEMLVNDSTHLVYIISLVLLVYHILNVLTGPGVTIMTFGGLVKTVSRVLVFSALLAIVLCTVSFYYFGALLGALSFVLSGAFLNCVASYIVYKRFGVNCTVFSGLGRGPGN